MACVSIEPRSTSPSCCWFCLALIARVALVQTGRLKLVYIIRETPGIICPRAAGVVGSLPLLRLILQGTEAAADSRPCMGFRRSARRFTPGIPAMDPRRERAPTVLYAHEVLEVRVKWSEVLAHFERGSHRFLAHVICAQHVSELSPRTSLSVVAPLNVATRTLNRNTM